MSAYDFQETRALAFALKTLQGKIQDLEVRARVDALISTRSMQSSW